MGHVSCSVLLSSAIPSLIYINVFLYLYFYLGCVCFPENDFWKITFQTFMCLFVIRKVGQPENNFPLKENLVWFPGKCFPFILGGKHFPEVVKKLEMSYYLLIISNLVLKLLIAIYILFWIFLFSISSLRI